MHTHALIFARARESGNRKPLTSLTRLTKPKRNFIPRLARFASAGSGVRQLAHGFQAASNGEAGPRVDGLPAIVNLEQPVVGRVVAHSDIAALFEPVGMFRRFLRSRSQVLKSKSLSLTSMSRVTVSGVQACRERRRVPRPPARDWNRRSPRRHPSWAAGQRERE